MFGHDWDPAEATIVARQAKFTGDGSTAIHEFVADVRPVEGVPFRATIQEPTIATDFWPPSVGDVVSVLVKTKTGKVKFDKDDDRISVKAFEASRQRAFDEVRNQQIGLPAASAGPSSATSHLSEAVAAQLAQLGIQRGATPIVLGGDPEQMRAAIEALRSSAGAGTAAAPAGDPADRLRRLESLMAQGLLTAEEYATQRARILDAL